MAETEDEYPSDLPPHTKSLIYSGGSWKMPGFDDVPCEGAKYHSPRALFTNEVRLVRETWGVEEHWRSPKAALCGTCAANLDILLQMIHATDGSLAWTVRREFGNEIRALANRGWTWFTENRPTKE